MMMYLPARLAPLLVRLSFRYVPAAFTIVISRQILQSGGDDTYSVFAFYVSLSALLPVIDLGHGNSILLSNGQMAALAASLRFSRIYLVCGALLLGAAVIFVPEIAVRHGVFILGGLLLLPLFFLSRHAYVTRTVDVYNLRSILLLMPLCMALLALLAIKPAMTKQLVPFAGLLVVFGALVCGLRLPDFKACVNAWRAEPSKSLRRGIMGSQNVHMFFVGLVAFLGAWSNVTLLFAFGTDDAVVSYDLVWRLLSVTMFAQIILAHSLPKLVENLSSSPARVSKLYWRLLGRAALLFLAQCLVVASIFHFYTAFYQRPISINLLAAGLSLAAVFSLSIPANHVLQARKQFWSLHIAFTAAALVSVLLKAAWLLGGLSAFEAFASTALGYGLAAIMLHVFVMRLE